MNSIKTAVNRAFTYSEYLELIKKLLAENKTTGIDHSSGMINYTKLNLSRMEKWNKIGQLLPEWEKLKNIKNQTWWLITEAWCGDASQIVPFIAKIAENYPQIELKIILRDENQSVMNQYLTDGNQAIPILVAIEYNHEHNTEKELFVWGPRPQNAQNLVKEWKKNPNNRTKEQLYEEMHTWYAHDKGTNIQQELFSKVSSN